MRRGRSKRLLRWSAVVDRDVLPELALAAVRRYCESKIPPEQRDEVRVDWEVQGRKLTILECRAPWDPASGSEWTRLPVAQLRFDPADNSWALYWSRSGGRWVAYELGRSTTSVNELLGVIDEDPTGVFWG